MYNPSIDGKYIGFEDQREILRDRLTKGPTQLDIVTIVGMPGLGKTYIAKKVYTELGNHFHVRAWCSVSKAYYKRKVLLEILKHLIELTDGIDRMSDEHLGQVLYKSLKGRKYLVVMDNVWTTEPWHDLCECFPDDNNGSRIMVTSQLSHVATQTKPESVPHNLRFFTEEESWKLFQEKIFHEESCPPELVDVGKQLAKTCKGLPLSVVVLAGLVGTMERKPESWEQIKREMYNSNPLLHLL